MTSSNFSWGILGFILTIITSIAAIVALASFGLADATVVAGLSLLASNGLVALSAVMNPNRKFVDEVSKIQDMHHNLQLTTNRLSDEAHATAEAAREVKKVLQ